MSINTEDRDILEYSLSTIKRISILISELESKVYNERLSIEKDFIVTKKQGELLLFLQDFPTPPSISELSRYLSTTHQNIKAICVNLENKKLVTLVSDSKDKRKQRIKLTIKGEREAYSLSKALNRISTEITPTFSSREIDELSRVLRKVEVSIYEQTGIAKKDSKN